MMSKPRSFRRALLIGASLGSLVIAGIASAQNGRISGGRGAAAAANPAEAAARAAQDQAAQQARASSASQRAIDAFRRAAAARSAMQNAQAAARAAAMAAQASVPNGLGAGGLQVAAGAALDPALWNGAKSPVQAQGADGRVTVTVDQTQQKAILHWDSFNVGRETDLLFRQGGTDWVALNRVTDAAADPSRILGTIKATGSVYLLNRNGVIFGGSAQVNVRSLVAAAATMTNDQFLARGLYSQLAGGRYLPSFTAAGGDVTVEAGAQIATAAPASVTAGGGFVMLLGRNVANRGAISTPLGQTALVAGDDFVLRRGFGTEENRFSSTRGSEVLGLVQPGSASGAVTNAGQIEASQGDISLGGRTIRQDGVAVVTSGVNQRGTIHLLNSAADRAGSVTLGRDSLTLVLPDLDSKDRALDGQRDALAGQAPPAYPITNGFDDRSTLADRFDQGRVEIVTGGNVRFEGGSQTVANGGQVAVQAAAGRITVADGARIDVSGVMGVALDMASNAIQVNVQGNELRDSPDNRDATGLKNQNVWIDVRDLVRVPSGTGGYQGDRYYTPGGLLEVGGQVANVAHGIGEWAAVGGTVTLAAREIVAQRGAVIDLSGGSLDYAAGYLQSSQLLGDDGRLYDARTAPAGVRFVAVGNAALRRHDRWGETYGQVFAGGMFSRGTSARWEEGYSVGRDAGQLVLAAPTVLMEADIAAEVLNTARQTDARPANVADGYRLGQFTRARAGALRIGNYDYRGLGDLFASEVRIGAVAGGAAADAAADGAIAADRVGTVWLDSGRLGAQGLGELTIGTRGAVAITGALTLADGGRLDITAPRVTIDAPVTAVSGHVGATNLFRPAGAGAAEALTLDGTAAIMLGDRAALDLRGRWIDARGTTVAPLGLGLLDGGSVSFATTRDLAVAAGARIDVSSGAALLVDGTLRGGRGGDVGLAAAVDNGGLSPAGQLRLDGTIRGAGVNGGGRLLLQSSRVAIGAAGADADDDGIALLTPDRFATGFSTYEVVGGRGLEVRDGTRLDVTMPVYRLAPDGNGLALWTPPLWQEDPLAGRLGRRGGADLVLRTSDSVQLTDPVDAIRLRIGRDAVVGVDPGRSITLGAPGAMLVEGRLNAWGGRIDLRQNGFSVRNVNGVVPVVAHDRAIEIGANAVLDVAARAAVATDQQGHRYGVVADGGRITIGGTVDHASGAADVDNVFVVVRPGARLDASGAAAVLDLDGRPAVTVASNGGTIALGSATGLYLDGTFVAAAGGAGAAGGTLDIALGSTAIDGGRGGDPRLARPREFVVSQQATPASAPADAAGLVYGHGALSVAQLDAGGFGSLGLAVSGQIAFAGDTALSLGRSVQLYSLSLALAEAAADDARVTIAAPYVRIGGVRPLAIDAINLTESVVGGTSSRTDHARLSVQAGLLDIRDHVGFGAGGTLPALGGPLAYDRRGFADVRLASSGDLRFVASAQALPATRLTTRGALALEAVQIYPTTNAIAEVRADTIRIARVGTTTPDQPYSAFGQLALYADTIDQGGVLRAPFGAITLGVPNGLAGDRGSTAVRLRAGSITSVSGAGLVMPYGGTVDGITYRYAGASLADTLLGRIPVVAGVTLRGQSVTGEAGAVIDISGGGTLTGAGFISGRGGSVDILRAPLAAANPAFGAAIGASHVYALVPGHAGPAPLAADAGAGDPLVGRQIVLDTPVGGLAAGRYTLMPSTYALLPGAFRVEIADAADPRGLRLDPASVGNGSFAASARLAVAGTNIADMLSRQILVTPAAAVRRLTLYNETDFAAFALADAARLGVPRIRLPNDAQTLTLDLARNLGSDPSFAFRGTLASAPGKGGWASQVQLAPTNGGSIEIVAAGAGATPGFAGVTVADTEIDALGAGRLLIGGRTTSLYGQTGNFVNFVSDTRDVLVRSGARLTAGDIFLVNGRTAGTIAVEQGASLNTLDRGTVGQDSRDGFIYAPNATGVLAVANSYLTLTAPVAGSAPAFGAGRIVIGGCPTASCSGTTTLYSDGTIVAATDRAFDLDNAVRYGTRNLTLAVGGVNVGTDAALASAAAANILPAGLALNQGVLDRLLRGDSTTGAPALETLVLNARDSVNFFGTVTLDTIDPATGKSRLANLVLTTGGIYGHGDAGDVATIRTGNLVWNGVAGAAPAVMAGGAGTGSGRLRIDARQIELGFGPDAVTSNASYDRLALGFGRVTLAAADRITANHRGSLAVHAAQGAYQPGSGFAYSGGDLDIVTPLVTGRAGSVNAIRAGGAVHVGGAGSAGTVGDLGGELSIRGASVAVDTAITLPSGKLTLAATGDVSLGAGARLDLSGREVAFDDVRKYSWGGELLLDSRDGNITQAAGSVIDLSARNNQAGILRATALADAAGQVRLLGTVRGTASGDYDAGGTRLPYRAGAVELRGQGLGDFAALNRMLNDGGVTGARSFQIRRGDLTIGDELRAGSVAVSLDGGALTVAGTIDASGVSVGQIRLAARHGLTIAGGALLDAHGTGLRVDSYGRIIDSPNRAIVALASGNGTLTLAPGARIDLRAGTGVAAGTAPGQNDGLPRGTLDLDAPRLGNDDVAIDVAGAVSILGARSVAVNAMRRYTGDDLPTGGAAGANGRPYQVIDQAWLDARHAESTAFIDAALANDALVNGRLAGLNTAAYRNAFHLRPGIEVAAAGDLVVSGDLDLSGHRYASLNPVTPRTAALGSGEVGSLVLRAGGDLSVYGSITDGFAPPPAGMPEEKGWLLLAGVQPFNADVVVPRDGIALHPGTRLPAGQALNYAVPIRGLTVAAGTRLPVAATLAGAVTLPADTILAADIRNPDGSLAHAAGTRLAAPLALDAGMQLGAGMLLPVAAPLAALVWPQGVPLPHQPGVFDVRQDTVTLDATVTLPLGARIPAGSTLDLGAGVDSVALRPGDGTGRSWALAPMLPEGSQSWNVRLVAGADLAAADNRLTDPRAETGRLVLADLHYGMKGTRVVSGGGGTGPLALTEEGALSYLGDASFAGLTEEQLAERLMREYGMTIEDFFGLSFADICASAPGICARLAAPAALALTEEGALAYFGDASFAGLTEVQLAERLMREYGLTIEETVGLSFADVCASRAGLCAAPDTGGTVSYTYAPAATSFSVVRTGTGDLDLASAGDLSMQSLFGVYTAGTSSIARDAARAAGLDQPRGTIQGDRVLGGAGHEQYVDGGEQSLYRAWYPDHGGNLGIRVGGNLTGDLVGRRLVQEGVGDTQFASSDIGNWLWRQSAAQGTGIPTAWWINFGTYATDPDYNITGTVGFTGFGTLGGGNLAVEVAGDAGTLAFRGDPYVTSATRSQGLVLAVGGTGRIVDGALVQTGGGDLDLRVGGGLNPALAGRAFYDGGARRLIANRADLGGTIVNLRGAVRVDAGAVGGIEPVVGGDRSVQDVRETRAYSPFLATIASATGGLTLAPGDATVRISSRGDLVLGGVADAGRAQQRNPGAWRFGDAAGTGGGLGWFSLWTGRTAIDLFAAGGNLTPITAPGETTLDGEPLPLRDVRPVDGRYVYPSILRAVAAGGNLYYGSSGLYTGTATGAADTYSLTLAPSRDGALELLAGGSIYAGGYAVSRSGAALSTLVTPFNPGFAVDGARRDGVGLSPLTGAALALFGFGYDSVGGEPLGTAPSRFYARDGDLVGVRTGGVLRLGQRGITLYQGAGPVWMKAGRDIVGSGSWLGTPDPLPRTVGNAQFDSLTGNLFVHGGATDLSLVSAGRDILYSGFQVAGPGQLEVVAGRNILEEDRAGFASLGAIVPGDTRPGASIALMAGMAAGADWAALRARYLDPANLADPARPLADQPGKAVRVYTAELRAWLAGQTGFAGTDAQALAAFDALPPERQRIFLRQLYFAELRAGGREYNDPASSRFGSYLRGRTMIATLFPEKDAAGAPVARTGDIVLFGGSGVRTDFGGNIEMLAPGGQIVVGVQGAVPPASAGVVTQGQGDIRLFSQGSLLLGLSRIMTTFGGDIFAWSVRGDINAGRGAKSTILYTPPRRFYDNDGNVSLAPQVPSSGAGIATLNPIAEVRPGDVDLIAPLGTIDAGEAGIRVSGSVNLAALQVVNAANIQVQGNATGIPLVAAVNTGALTAAGSAATAVTAEATRVVERNRPPLVREVPSIITVTFAGFGEP